MHPASIVFEPSARNLHGVHLLDIVLPRYAWCRRYMNAFKCHDKLQITSVHGLLQRQSLSVSRCSSSTVI